MKMDGFFNNHDYQFLTYYLLIFPNGFLYVIYNLSCLEELFLNEKLFGYLEDE